MKKQLSRMLRALAAVGAAASLAACFDSHSFQASQPKKHYGAVYTDDFGAYWVHGYYNNAMVWYLWDSSTYTSTPSGTLRSNAAPVDGRFVNGSWTRSAGGPNGSVKPTGKVVEEDEGEPKDQLEEETPETQQNEVTEETAQPPAEETPEATPTGTESTPSRAPSESAAPAESAPSDSAGSSDSGGSSGGDAGGGGDGGGGGGGGGD